MTTCVTGQSASNMLRHTFVVLQFCSILALCCCYFVRGHAYRGAPISIDCKKDGNSTCGSATQEIQSTSSQMTVDLKKLGENNVEGDGGIEEVTSRKKKDKGYNMLLYFLGAGKLTMLYAVINTVAAIAAKALIVAKVALAIATALALKKSSEHKEKVSYEIIKHPYHTYEHTHSSSIDFEPHSSFDESDWNRRKVFS